MYILLCLDGMLYTCLLSPFWVIRSVSSLISLLSFYLADLSSGESGMKNSPTLSGANMALIYDLSFSGISFTYDGALYWGHRCSILRFPLNQFFLCQI